MGKPRFAQVSTKPEFTFHVNRFNGILNSYARNSDQPLPLVALTPERVELIRKQGKPILEWAKPFVLRVDTPELFAQITAAENYLGAVHKRYLDYARQDAHALARVLQEAHVPVDVSVVAPKTGLADNWRSQGEHLLYMRDVFGCEIKINPKFTNARFYSLAYYLDLRLKPGYVYDIVA